MRTGLFFLLAGLICSGAEHSWNQPQAKVLETGQLEWAPQPYAFKPGSSMRYIDFENGDDCNAGTKESPWKHHPWDPEASGSAGAPHRGVHTYVFKQGVVYRGNLVADKSGTQENPIRLCSDPEWGVGEASIYGSVRLTGGWTRGSAETVPGVEEPDKVWYQDVGNKISRFDRLDLIASVRFYCQICAGGNWRV